MAYQTAEALSPLLILSQADFFRGLTPEQLCKVAELSRLQACSEGEQIYRLGEPAVNLYVLVDGMVRLAIGLGNRSATVGDILRCGQPFGWAALTPAAGLRSATASCLSPCRFLAIKGAELIAVMNDDHTLGYGIMTRLNRLVTGTPIGFVAG